MSRRFPGLFVCFVVPGLLAQSIGAPAPAPAHPRYVFQPAAERLGISTATITALAQDRAGFLWMGTQQGVLRYDGGRITRFGREEGLPTLFIDQLEVASDGKPWVGTNDGIARFNGVRFERIQIPVAGARFDSMFQILAAGRSGGMYVATTAGLLRIDQKDPAAHKLWTRRDGLPADAVEAVYTAPDGVVYFICGNHVGRLRSATANPEILAPEISTGAAAKSIAVLVDGEGAIWVRTASSVLRLAPGGSRFTHEDQGIPQANDFGIPALDRSGQLMIPTVRGLFRRTGFRWEQIGERQGMESDAVFAAVEDQEGAIWVGYGGSGVARWPGSRSWSAWTKTEGLPDNVVWCEARDPRGRLWVGTDNGLAMWDPAAGTWRTWTEKEGLAGSTVRQLLLGADNAIWSVSVPGGVSRIDLDSLRAAVVPAPHGTGDAAGIALGPDGRIWAGNHHGLRILTRRGGGFAYEDFAVPPEAAGTTTHPVFAGDGTLWSSGRQGISRFDGHRWGVYTTAQGLRANVVPTVVPVSGSEAWFRYVEPLGLGHMKITGAAVEVRHFTTKEGLASNSVFLLGRDAAGRIWAGGSEGLDAVDASGKVHGFTRADGLIWNDLSAGSFWADADGSIFAGTSRGLARFHPAPQDFNVRHAGVVITSASLGGVDRVNEKNPRAPYSKRTFTAQFAALSFRDAEKTPCRYRMQGLESEYTETLQREARYVSLPSGGYSLEVSCRCRDGVWSTPAIYEFSVAPAWWERWWARLLILSLILCVLAAAIRLRTRALEAERHRLEQAVDARSAELARANHELAEAALTDPLTKARNRRYFQMTIEADAQRAVRSYFDPGAHSTREDLIFYLVDVDHFKRVNDEFGHQTGDLVLRQVAGRLQETIRASDTLIRWGGEEFLVVARGSRRQDARDLANRILEAVGGRPFESEHARTLGCTCSVGWAAFPWSCSEPESRGLTEVIQLVDRALYMAKHSGRNQCVGLEPVAAGDESRGDTRERLTIKQERVAVVRSYGPEPGRNAHVAGTADRTPALADPA